MNELKEWVRIPSRWVVEGKLRQLSWKEHGAEATAALMILAPLAHNASLTPVPGMPDVGWARLPFEGLSDLTGISRPKLGPAFDLLEQRLQIVTIDRPGTGHANRYRLHQDPPVNGVIPFAKMPCRSMHSPDRQRLEVFRGFTLRSRNELDALKLFFLFVALRDEKANAARINFQKISEHTGVHEDRIKSATSLLLNARLIQIDQELAPGSKYRHNIYRIVGVKPRFHSGTINRAEGGGTSALDDFPAIPVENA